MVSKLPVIKHIIKAQIHTMKVRYAVAKFEFTSLIPIFARIVVNEVNTAPINVTINQTVLKSSLCLLLYNLIIF